MGLLIVVDWISDRGAGSSTVLWIMLAAAVGLTYWECRDRGYRARVLLWWMTLVAITHVPGYIILRFFVRPPSRN